MKCVLRITFAVFVVNFHAWSAIDLTTPTGGTITYAASLSGYQGTRAFDDVFPLTTGGRWLVEAGTFPDAYVTYAFNEGVTHVVQAYRIWNLVEYSTATRAPKDFTLQGSSNGVDWVVLDSRTGETGWGDGESRLYVFANSVPYSHFKFNISTNNGASDFSGVSELEFYEIAEDNVPPSPAVSPSPSDGSTGTHSLVSLEWIPDWMSESHQVYFGTNSSFVSGDLLTNTTRTVCNTGYLDFNTTYYWRVDSSNQFGVTTGTVWNFTTRMPDPEFVAYEGFEGYTTGLLNGQGAVGDGWNSSWTAHTSGVEVVQVSLFYDGGEVQVDGGAHAVKCSVESTEALHRLFTVLVGDVVYFSALVNRKSPILGSQLLSVGLKDGTLGSGEENTSGFNFGYPGGYINAEVQSAGTGRVRVSTGIPVVADQTCFIVARLSRSDVSHEFEIADVLVNPASVIEPDTGWTRAEHEPSASPVISKINIRSYFMSAGEIDYIDEIRVGTTYEAVFPVKVKTSTLILVQ